MLVTVLLQSSSTTTSIIVSLVGAGSIPVEPAIFMVMGERAANAQQSEVWMPFRADSQQPFFRWQVPTLERPSRTPLLPWDR